MVEAYTTNSAVLVSDEENGLIHESVTVMTDEEICDYINEFLGGN